MTSFPSYPPGLGGRVLGGALVLVLIASAVALNAVAWATPRVQYRIDDATLEVRHRFGPFGGTRRFARDAVRAADVTGLPRGSSRAVGTALPGLCVGRWSTPEGPAYVATDCGAAGVRLRTDDGDVYLSPPDPAAFLDALRHGSPRLDLLPTPSPSVGMRVLAVVAALVVAVATVHLGRAVQRGLVYGVGAATLVVPGHLRPVRISLRGARATRRRLGAWRMAGTAVPGALYLGAFWDSAPLHAAATRADDGWLIEGDRRAYVTPRDMDAFAAAIVREGAEIVAP